MPRKSPVLYERPEDFHQQEFLKFMHDDEIAVQTQIDRNISFEQKLEKVDGKIQQARQQKRFDHKLEYKQLDFRRVYGKKPDMMWDDEIEEEHHPSQKKS